MPEKITRDSAKGDNGAEGEFAISADGISLKGSAYSDLSKYLQNSPLTTTIDSILELLDNTVGLGADYLNYKLRPFRAKYRENMENVPIDQRKLPEFRVGCSVLKNVSFSIEEHDIQELFANLLASASDKRKSKNVHIGYSTIINELEPDDARVLMEIKQKGMNRIDEAFYKSHSIETSNLIRLGLLGYEIERYSEAELSNFVGKKDYSAISNELQARNILIEVVNDLQRLKNTIIRERRDQHKKIPLKVTEFGRAFMLSVIDLQDQE